MAEQFSSSIYRINDNDLLSGQQTPALMGVVHSFPSNGVRIYAARSGTVANGVTMNAIIAMLPKGLNQPEKKFYTPDSVSTLVDAANAPLA